MKQMRKENLVLKEQNIKFKNEITILGNHINILNKKLWKIVLRLLTFQKFKMNSALTYLN